MGDETDESCEVDGYGRVRPKETLGAPSTSDRRRAGSNSDRVDTEEELRVDLVRRIGSSGAGACGKFSCRPRTRTR